MAKKRTKSPSKRVTRSKTAAGRVSARKKKPAVKKKTRKVAQPKTELVPMMETTAGTLIPKGPKGHAM